MTELCEVKGDVTIPELKMQQHGHTPPSDVLDGRLAQDSGKKEPSWQEDDRNHSDTEKRLKLARAVQERIDGKESNIDRLVDSDKTPTFAKKPIIQRHE